MIKKFVLAIFLILFILGLFIFIYSGKFKVQAVLHPILTYNCQKTDGILWETKDGYECYHVYEDGGRRCESSNECVSGECLVVTILNEPPGQSHCRYFKEIGSGCKVLKEEYNLNPNIVEERCGFDPGW